MPAVMPSLITQTADSADTCKHVSLHEYFMQPTDHKAHAQQYMHSSLFTVQKLQDQSLRPEQQTQ